MPDLEKLKSELQAQAPALKQAENEMMFVQASFRPLRLPIKPMWPIFIAVAVFLVECTRAVKNKSFNISIISWVILAVLAVAYTVYVCVMAKNNRDYNRSRQALFEQKTAVYQALHEERQKLFEQYVAQSGVICLKNQAENNNYLWLENDALVICRLHTQLTTEIVPTADIRYISSDDRLLDYSVTLGVEHTVNADTPYCYIFTTTKCYVFLSEGYTALCALLPNKELSAVLTNRSLDKKDAPLQM